MIRACTDTDISLMHVNNHVEAVLTQAQAKLFIHRCPEMVDTGRFCPGVPHALGTIHCSSRTTGRKVRGFEVELSVTKIVRPRDKNHAPLLRTRADRFV